MSIKTSSSGAARPDKTVQRISAEGDIRLKYVTLLIVGGILLIITIGFVYGTVTTQGAFEKHAQSMGTLISGGIFGLIGFIAGRASRGGGES